MVSVESNIPPDILYFLVLLTFLVLPFIVGSLLILQTP